MFYLPLFRVFWVLGSYLRLLSFAFKCSALIKLPWHVAFWFIFLKRLQKDYERPLTCCGSSRTKKSMDLEMEIMRALKISPEINFSFLRHFQPMDDENDDITFQTTFIIISLTKQAKWKSIFNAEHYVWVLCNLIVKINWTLHKDSKFLEGRCSTIL